MLTRAKREENESLVEIGSQNGIKFVFAKDLAEILTDYAMDHMGLEVFFNR